MPRVSLKIDRGPHPVAAQIGYPFTATRITAQAALKTTSGWTPYKAGIVDTGATVSLFPLSIWRDAERQVIGEVQVSGAVPLEQSRIRAKLARLWGRAG